MKTRGGSENAMCEIEGALFLGPSTLAGPYTTFPDAWHKEIEYVFLKIELMVPLYQLDTGLIRSIKLNAHTVPATSGALMWFTRNCSSSST